MGMENEYQLRLGVVSCSSLAELASKLNNVGKADASSPSTPSVSTATGMKLYKAASASEPYIVDIRRTASFATYPAFYAVRMRRRDPPTLTPVRR